jgi:23S rRNA (cytidine2498-2'-O)-methyltransferase
MTAEEFRARFPEAVDSLAPSAEWAGEWNTCAGAGERILNVIAVSEKEVWFGITDLRDAEFGWPGGESRTPRAADSPSRASVKIEEAIALLERKAGGPILKSGERAIEVGAAPGGAVHALLARGLRVTGVDRAEMAPVVREHPGFTWVDSSIGDWMFPESTEAEWLALDMNAEPRIALRETKPLVDYVKRGLKGVFFTLKLNQVDFALNAERLGKTLAKDLNLTTWFLKQLPSNHQEVAFFGLTSRATAKVFVRS